MSLTPQLLCQDLLFSNSGSVNVSSDDIQISTSPVNFPDFYNSISSNFNILSQSFSLLKSSTSLEDSIKIWEIRLLWLIFNDKLLQAKQEATNLNNTIYISELGEVPPNPPRVLPLPRNNNGHINHRLLVLLLRLKSVPNLTLVNEFYKLCYQLRLRDHEHLSQKLVNLSYDIMVVLLINKNYSTLLNLLYLMENEMKLVKGSEVQIDRFNLLIIITRVFIYQQSQTPREIIRREMSQWDSDFGALKSSLDCLKYVLATVEPIYSPGSAESNLVKLETLSLDDLVSMVLDGKITTRIVCCTLGIWDLQNNYGFELNENGFLSTETDIPEEIGLSDCYLLMCTKWLQHITKVYGLE